MNIYELMLRNAEGGGSGGGDAGSGSGAGADDEAGAGAAAGEGAGAGDGQPAASADAGQGGLVIPEHLRGANDQETMAKMAKALEGYRKRDSQQQAEIPEDAAAYAAFDMESLPEIVRPHMSELAKDQAFERVAKKAQELGVPVAALQGLTAEFYGVAAEMGVLEPLLDVKAEQAALTPENARHLPEAEQKAARERRMQDNFTWMERLAQDQAAPLDPAVAKFVSEELGDSAKGHQFIEYLRQRMSGGDGPYVGSTGAPGGGDPKEAIKADFEKPENMPGNPKFNKATYDALMQKMQTLHGA